MGSVRHFHREDIPQVIELNTRLFPGSSTLTKERQEEIFNQICFHNPWFDEEISSLVYEDDNGKITGFLGVIPRHMHLNGRTIRMAVSQHLMVDNVTFGSLQLLKALFSGPQDVTMTDMSVDVVKKLWERLGGLPSYLHSIYWIRPLRPASAAFSYFLGHTRKGNGSPLDLIATGFDTLTRNFSKSPFRVPDPVTSDEPMNVDQFLQCVSAESSQFLLRPNYTAESAQWLFSVLEREERFGRLQRKIVRDGDGNLLGWYIYNLQPYGRSEVLQIGAAPQTITGVIRHLMYDAWNNESIEIAGRLDPRFMKEFSDHHFLFNPAKNWMLIHSGDKEISNAILTGNAFLTRLEGDLWFF